MRQPEEREAKVTQAYLVATSLGIACIAPRPFLDNAFGPHISFLLVMPAVAVAGWWGGMGPAAVTAALSVCGTVGFYIARGGSLLDAGAAGTLIFILMSMTWLCWFGAQLHRLRLRGRPPATALQTSTAAVTAAQAAAPTPDAIELQRQLEQQRARLEMARRDNEEFLANLSHELRTPLNAILGWARLLDADPASTPPVRHAAEVIARNARHQADLIDELFDIHRVLDGSVALQIEDVEVAAVLERALQAWAEPLAEKRIEAHNHVPAGVRVRADAMRLQQMLRNLIGNAVKFTPEGGHIRLSAEHGVQGWVIAVEDTGEGIAQAFLPHVFERFRQGDASSTRRHGGLGVGLAVVKALAEVQHGEVRAFSDGVGQGARFEIELPALPAASTTGEQAASGWPQSLAGVRALVVDDETDSRELVCEILQRHGAHVDMAADAAAALRRRLTGRYELLVCDIAMPGMDGHELLRQWLRLEGRRPRRAIALTAFADAANRLLAEEAGYDCLLAKPVEPGELIDAASAPRITQVRAGPRLTPSRSGKTALQ